MRKIIVLMMAILCFSSVCFAETHYEHVDIEYTVQTGDTLDSILMQYKPNEKQVPYYIWRADVIGDNYDIFKDRTRLESNDPEHRYYGPYPVEVGDVLVIGTWKEIDE